MGDLVQAAGSGDVSVSVRGDGAEGDGGVGVGAAAGGDRSEPGEAAEAVQSAGGAGRKHLRPLRLGQRAFAAAPRYTFCCEAPGAGCCQPDAHQLSAVCGPVEPRDIGDQQRWQRGNHHRVPDGNWRKCRAQPDHLSAQ